MSGAAGPRSTPSRPRTALRDAAAALGAAAVYLALTLVVLAPILVRPSIAVLFPERASRAGTAGLIEADQRFVTGTIARNARALLEDPLSLLGQGSCYPVDRAFTLGEHLLGESLLAAVPYALFRDPLLASNAVVALSIWIAALSMYALVFGLTRSSGAAFVAGLVFAFHPARIGNPSHPMVHGNLWTPLALLFAERLFRRGRWRDALLLAVALALQLLESFYQILGLAILGGVCGVALAVRWRRALIALAPKLALVAAVALAVVAIVLVPYLDTRAAWGVLRGRDLVLFFAPGDYLPGRPAGFGWVPLVLAAIGALDRVRGPRGAPATDLRLPLLAGALLVFWCSVRALDVPWMGRLESPLVLLAGIVPGLDAVRVPRAVRFNVYLVVAVLAGYGAIALGELLARRRGDERTRVRAGLPALRARWASVLVPPALAAAILAEVFTPRLAEAGYAWAVRFVARPMAPPRELVELYARVPEGAVLDLPFRDDAAARLLAMPRFVFLGGYHGQPVAACASSFETQLQGEIARLAARLPDREALDELRALGFASAAVHDDLLAADERDLATRLVAERDRATLVGAAAGVTLVALTSPLPVVAGFAALAPAAGDAERGSAAARETVGAAAAAAIAPMRAGARGEVAFALANPTAATYRHPAPIEPADLVVRWRDAGGAVVHEERVRGLLPLALAPGARTTRTIAATAPPVAGDYDVELVLAARPERALGRATVAVRAADTGAGARGAALSPAGRVARIAAMARARAIPGAAA